MDKAKIRTSFNGAASTYDQYAIIQEHAAQELAELTSNLSIPSSILEIGCGTGNLTKKLLKKYPEVTYYATDIAEQMLLQAQKKLSQHANLTYSVADGEKIPNFTPPFQWIVSSLTFQWFSNQLKTIEKLFNNCEVLIFSTLVDNTFIEWIELCQQFGIKVGTISFVSSQEIIALCNNLSCSTKIIKFVRVKESFNNPLEFMRSIKKIGAYQANADYSIENLKKLCDNYRKPIEISYELAYCIIS